jgi:Zn-dependent protease
MSGITGFGLDLAYWIVLYNLLLAIFNLLPIPPLDGYNMLLAFLPPKAAFTVQRYAQYGVIVLLLLVFLPNSPLGLMFDIVGNLTGGLTGA